MQRLILWLALLVSPASAHAITLRYAAVIGTDVGIDPEKGPLPPLLHAEREAKALHAKLLDCCNFDASAARTILLVRPSRARVKQAIADLVAQMKADRRTYGEVETLFAFFFTGHGLDGRILLNDGPLSKEELGEIFRSVGADLTLGVFDACYSASLDPGTLKAKGLRPTPGINVLSELPQEVLGAEGSVWFVSSGPEEESYEDRELGGVFTHFLIEALERAEARGPGIPLDSIWSYAQSRTQAHTSARARPQHPQRIISKMRERSSIYFSFPTPRDAVLSFGSDVRGTFVLIYEGGHLSERIVKAEGAPADVAVYPGTAQLKWIEEGELRGEQQVELASGTSLVLSTIEELPPQSSMGKRVQGLWVKGVGAQTLRADRVEPRSSISIGAGYDFAWSGRGRLLPRHAASLLLRWDQKLLVVEGRIAYGYSRESFPAWGYEAHALIGEIRAGLGFDLFAGRVTMLAAIGGGPLFQRYQDGSSRTVWHASPKAIAGVTWPIFDPIALRLDLEGGAVIAPGAGAQSDVGVSPSIGASLSMILLAF